MLPEYDDESGSASKAELSDVSDLRPGARCRPRQDRGGAAEEQVDALARRIVAGSGCSYPQAFVQALNSHPALYERYLREHLAALGSGHQY
jgi:hypothetical protein